MYYQNFAEIEKKKSIASFLSSLSFGSLVISPIAFSEMRYEAESFVIYMSISLSLSQHHGFVS